MIVAISANDTTRLAAGTLGAASAHIGRLTRIADIIHMLCRHHPHVLDVGLLERAIERRRIAQALRAEEPRMTFCLVVRMSSDRKVECGALTMIPKQPAEAIFAGYGPAPMLFGFLFGFASYPAFQDVFEEIGRVGVENNRQRITGPFEATINYSCGLLEANPAFPLGILMPHNPIQWNGYFEEFGFTVAERLFTFEINFSRAKFTGLSAKLASNFAITLQELRPPYSSDQRAAIVELFNSGWRGNWGFVPFDLELLERIEKEFSPILWPGLSFLAYKGDRAVGLLVAVPDLNEITRMKSSGFGLNVVAAAWRFFVRRRARAVRILILGLRPELQGTREGVATIEFMMETGQKIAEARHGATHLQFGWTLSSNHQVNRLAERWAPDAQRVVHRIWQSKLPYAVGATDRGAHELSP